MVTGESGKVGKEQFRHTMEHGKHSEGELGDQETSKELGQQKAQVRTGLELPYLGCSQAG